MLQGFEQSRLDVVFLNFDSRYNDLFYQYNLSNTVVKDMFQDHCFVVFTPILTTDCSNYPVYRLLVHGGFDQWTGDAYSNWFHLWCVQGSVFAVHSLFFFPFFYGKGGIRDWLRFVIFAFLFTCNVLWLKSIQLSVSIQELFKAGLLSNRLSFDWWVIDCLVL